MIYRDGVGDGQIDIVKSHEIPQFIEAFKKLGNNYKYVFYKFQINI